MKKHLLILLVFGLLMHSFKAKAQVSSLPCNTPTALTTSLLPNLVIDNANTSLSIPLVYGTWNDSNVINASLTDYATITAILGIGNASLAVKDPTGTLDSNTYAGFAISNSNLLNISLGGGYVTVSTTYNGAVVESTTFTPSLLSVALLSSSGTFNVGLLAKQAFNGVKITVGSTVLSVNLGDTKIYYPIIQKACAPTTSLPINMPAIITRPSYPILIDNNKTGAATAVNVSLGSDGISNVDNLIDSDTSNYATIFGNAVNVAVGSTANVAAKLAGVVYPNNTFVGFDLTSPSLLSVDLVNNIKVNTYLNDTLQESITGSGTNLLGLRLLANGKTRIGLLASKPFDEVQLSVTKPINVALFSSTQVYDVVVEKMVDSSLPPYNQSVNFVGPNYPVYVNSGGSGILSLNGDVQGADNVVDANTSNYATLGSGLGANALSTTTLSVKKALSKIPGNTFAGFSIQNPMLLNVNVLNNMKVSAYKNGNLVSEVNGNTALLSVPTFINNDTGRTVIGFVPTDSFDEIALTMNYAVGVNLGVTKVYNAVITPYNAGSIGCNSNYWLSSPDYPVYVDFKQTGISGLVSVSSGVDNADNVVSASQTDYATLSTVANVAANTSIAVKDAISIYPNGTIAGFAIENANPLLQLSLLQAVAVSTYKNGVLQEVSATGNLLNLSLLVPLIGNNQSIHYIGFVTTKPFDEVKLSLVPLVGVAPVINVYGAFVDTRYVDSFNSSTYCRKPPVAENDHIATNVGQLVTGSLATNDYDPKGLALIYTVAQDVTGGSLTVSANGAFSYESNSNFVGVDSFKVKICNLDTCATSWAFVSVNPVTTPGSTINHKPLAQNDEADTYPGKPVSGDASSNDIDPNGGILSYNPISDPSNGHLSLNTNGTWTYTPDTGFIGVDTAYVQVCNNGTPNLCDTTIIVFNTHAVLDTFANHRPYAHDDIFAAIQGVTASGNVLANDSDPDDNSVLSASLITSISPDTGILSINNGIVKFVPNSQFTGSLRIAYKACDNGNPSMCDTATVTLLIKKTIELPIVKDDHIATNRNNVIAANIATNDKDPKGLTLSYSTIIPTIHGTLILNTDGTLIYTPDSTFVGVDSFKANVCNADTCAQSWGYFTVIAPADTTGIYGQAPLAQNDESFTYPGKSVTGNASSNDVDPNGGNLTYSAISAPINGVGIINTDGSYTYTPNVGFIGNDTAYLKVCNMVSCDTTMVVVHVLTPRDTTGNHSPFAADDILATFAGNMNATSINVLANDSDPDSNALTATLITIPTATQGTASIDENGVLTFLPATSFEGTIALKYTACDNGNPSKCDTATIYVTVRPLTISVQVQALLQGAMSGSTMTTTLNTLNLIPLSQPYNSSLFNYHGSEQVSSIPSGVTDWILIELRSNSNINTVLAQSAALIKNDGTIVNIKGGSNITFSANLSSGKYYISVKHRNHLRVLSSGSQTITSATPLYDFTSAITQSYANSNNNSLVQISGKWCLWAGDVNQNGYINGSDLSQVLNYLINSNNTLGQNVYNAFDINLNSYSNTSDASSIRTNIIALPQASF